MFGDRTFYYFFIVRKFANGRFHNPFCKANTAKGIILLSPK